MGSWYATCFMSHLPIVPGDRVAAIIVAPRNHGDIQCCTCNADDYFVPIGTPIFGEYDDHGALDNIQPNDYMLRYLRQANLTMFASDKNYTPYKVESLENIVSSIAHRDIYMDNNRLDMILIHEELYYNLLNEVANRIPYDYTESLRDLHIYSIKKAIEKMAKGQNNLKRVMDEGMHIIPELQGSILFNRLRDYLHYSNDIRWNSMDWFADEYLKTNDDALINIIADFILWDTVMNYSRSAYGCAAGRGSQSREMKLQTIVAGFVIAKSLIAQSEVESEYVDKTDTDRCLRDTMYFWEE